MPGELLRTVTASLSRPTKRKMEPSSDLFLITDQDVAYEQDIQRNPGSVKPWLDYYQFKRSRGKLHVRPPEPIREGGNFKIALTYSGRPRPLVDPDGSQFTVRFV